MIIVDDKLSLDVLAGRYVGGSAMATTWTFHYRLLRALADPDRAGSLSRDATSEVRRIAAQPPAARLRVLDPRTVTLSAAGIAARHGLNLLAAELVASALHFDADVHLSARNVGTRWSDAMAAEGIRLTVV